MEIFFLPAGPEQNKIFLYSYKYNILYSNPLTNKKLDAMVNNLHF